ncbi:MFS transporter [Paenarthrobacter sp. DKR-5]|uniref:MFS transporter n=1 Tax=Paenarthrobacter sp. DKR-5 TaxID=2835535 RepID=UPI001BDDA474|nr:MFS transporter [Paenarthrobacter sp. DKR-5]MBT1003482.1 MFS transporter [Paenarthrobacter sp. DKR-5]
MSALTEEARSRTVVGNILKGSLGNLVEWFDFYSFTVFAAYFGAAVFNKHDEASSLLDAYSVFAAGFLFRPVGSWFFGRYADRRGRRAALTLSILLMAAGSLLMALVPSYAVVGLGSPALVFLARAVQGFSVGGEYGTSATYMSEAATRGRRGFYSSFQYVTLVSGQVLALLVQILLQNTLSEGDLKSWGWRIPFAIGAAAALTVLWLRRSMAETVPAEQMHAARSAAKGEAAPGTFRLLARHWKPFLVVFGLTLGGTVSFYTYTTFMQSWMSHGIPDKKVVTLINFCALFLFMILQPVYGALSDRIGRKPLLIWFGIAGAVFTWPILAAIYTNSNPFVAFLLMMAALLIVLGYTSINALVKAELFPSSIRALGVGLGYGLANALFGGTAPYVGQAFKDAHNNEGFYVYVIVCIAVSLAVYIWAFSNKSATYLDAEQGHAYGRPQEPEAEPALSK